LLSVAINELILAYWRFAKSHYVKDGEPTRTLPGIRATRSECLVTSIRTTPDVQFDLLAGSLLRRGQPVLVYIGSVLIARSSCRFVERRGFGQAAGYRHVSLIKAPSSAAVAPERE
jgi:hypothetical protein